MYKHFEQVFIFDLDDTLYKEVDFVLSAYRHIDRLLVAEYGMNPGIAFKILTRNYDLGINPFSALNDHMIEILGIRIPDAINWMVSEYRYHLPDIHLDNGTKYILNYFKQYYDVPMYIITDGRSITQRNKIRALSIDKYIPWENIFISEEVGYEKTDPYSFSLIRDRHVPSQTQFYFVGDNPAKDFIVANMNNEVSIQLNNNGRNIHPQDIEINDIYKAKKYINNIQELEDFLVEIY